MMLLHVATLLLLAQTTAKTYRIGVIYRTRRWLEVYNISKLVVDQINNDPEILPGDNLELVYDPNIDTAAAWTSALPYDCYNNFERYDAISQPDPVTLEVTCQNGHYGVGKTSKFPSNFTHANFTMSLYLQKELPEAMALTMGVDRTQNANAGMFPHNATNQEAQLPIDAVITSTLSTQTDAFLPYMSMIKMPVVGWIANSGSLVDSDVNKQSGWFQRVTQNDDHSQMAIISFLEALGVERVGIAYVQYDSAGIAVRDRLATNFRTMSFELPNLATDTAKSAESSDLYAKVANDIRASGIKVLVVWPSWAIQGAVRWLAAHNIIGDPRYTVIMSTDANSFAWREFIQASDSELLALPLNSSVTGVPQPQSEDEALQRYRDRIMGLFYATAVSNDEADASKTLLPTYQAMAPEDSGYLQGVGASTWASIEDMVRTAAMGIGAAAKAVREHNAAAGPEDQQEVTRTMIRDEMRKLSIYSARYGNLTFLPNGDPDVPFAIVNYRKNATTGELIGGKVGHFAPSFIVSESEVLPLEMTQEERDSILWSDGVVGYDQSPFVPLLQPMDAMFALFKHFDWSRVGVIFNEADPDTQALRDAFAVNKDVEAVFFSAPDESYDEVRENGALYDALAQNLRDSDLRIIVVWPSWNAEALLRWLTVKGVIGYDQFTFILAPTATRVSGAVFDGSNALMSNTRAQLEQAVGMFSLAMQDETVAVSNWRFSQSEARAVPMAFSTWSTDGVQESFDVTGDDDVEWSTGKVGAMNRPLSTPVVIKKVRPMSEGVRVTLLVLSVIAIVGCVGTFVFLLKQRHLRYIRMSSWKINCVVLLGLLVACIGVILLGVGSQQVADYDKDLDYIPVEGLSDSEFLGVCNARLWLLPIAFTLTFGALFSKTFRVWRIFVNHDFNVRTISDMRLMAMVAVLLFVDVITMIAFHASSSFERTLTVDNEVPLPIEGNRDATEQFYFEHCSADGLDTFMGIFIATKGLILMFGLWMASETRNVEIPALNDSRSIATCVYVVSQVSLIMMPVSFVFDENDGQQSRYLLVGLCVLTMVYSTLGLLFVPKIYNVCTGEAEKLTTVLSKSQASTTTSGNLKRSATLRSSRNSSSTLDTNDVEMQVPSKSHVSRNSSSVSEGMTA